MQNAEFGMEAGSFLIRLTHERNVSRERTTQVDMACDGIGFLAVDEDLHAPRGGQIGGDGVDDGVDGEELVQRAALRSTNASPRSVT